MDGHQLQQAHKSASKDKHLGADVQDDFVSDGMNTEQSPGSLFVSQALLKQKPRAHQTSTKAITKHNLEMPDVSDFAFTSFAPIPQPPAKGTLLKLPSLTHSAGSQDEPLRPLQEPTGVEPKTSLVAHGYATTLVLP